MKKYIVISISILTLGFVSCDKMLNYQPDGAILAEDALKTPDDAQRLLNSCYDVMANVFDGSYQNLAELLSNNLATPTGLDFQAVYNKETNFFTPTTNGVYSDFYYSIYRCNSLLENFDLIDGLSEAERSRMEAEARFIRAYCHWHVVKLWAQPWGYTADNSHLGIVIRDQASNAPLHRNTVAEVYAFILSEMEWAANNLPESNGNYANANAAKGALAMIHFQMGDYSQAIQYCDEVINPSQFADTLLDRFPADVVNMVAIYNPETVFGIVSNNADVRTDDLIGNYNASGVLPPNLTLWNDATYSSSNELENPFFQFINVTGTDKRLSWIGTNGSRKTLNRFLDKVVFNVPLIYQTELMLIRAEAIAYAQPGRLNEAIADINKVRARAYSQDNSISTSSSADDVKIAARREYRIETIGEGKWLDQFRRLAAEGVVNNIRFSPWDCPGMAIQFPNNETTGAGFQLNPEGGCN
jgi:tetratricopeptide (TPR) repeat protein